MMEFSNFMLPPIEKGKFMSIIMKRPTFARSERQHFPRIRPLTAEEPNVGNGRSPPPGHSPYRAAPSCDDLHHPVFNTRYRRVTLR